MKKIIYSFFLLLIILPAVSSVKVLVEKQSSNEVMILGLDKPVVFDLKITNQGQSDNFEFYNLLGFSMFPIGTVPIGSGETKDIQLKVSPIGEFDYKGAYTFDYFIKGNQGSDTKETLTFRIVELKDAFEVGSGEIDPQSNSVEFYIENLANFNFGKVDAEFSSAFFNTKESFNLGPYEKKIFTIKLNKEDFKQLTSGFYTIDAKVDVDDKQTEVHGTLRYAEKNILTSTEREYGFLITTKIIKKINEGNMLAETETIIKKSIISRLFTSFSPEPNHVERRGVYIYYTWDQPIEPGEVSEIAVKTNWLFPLIIVLFVVAVVALAKQYTKTNLVLRKKVSFINAKGGEFALKVSIMVNAKKYVEKVNILDKLPPLVKLYERFGTEKPTRINEKLRRIEWNFEKLEPGETRMLSYLIYSKVGVLGKFALPQTTAIYEKDGELHESESNRAYFLAEQRRKEPGE